jgi:uncharacterized repeat protein (TIGR03803 family)
MTWCSPEINIHGDTWLAWGFRRVTCRFNGTDGSTPIGGLIADAHGDLFGTTAFGGANNLGTVFEITDSGFNAHPTPGCSVAESHDTFVFAPNLGENTFANFKAPDETIDHPKSDFADFAASLAQAHHDEAHPTDIMDHAATLTAQHAHHFLV